MAPRKKSNGNVADDDVVSGASTKPICGIVMPISAIDGCTEQHWSDVLEIVTEAIESAGFEPNVVSNADDVGIIQKRIIQNLYDNPVVVCDVSGKNPNVMFELGVRLAFDKPTIIIKDDKTSYSFDTAPIEHLGYPRDLRYSLVVDFKEKLSEKIQATYRKSTSDANYTTFLKHFGEFTVAKLDQKEVSGQEFILEEIQSMRSTLARIESRQRLGSVARDRSLRQAGDLNYCLRGKPYQEVDRLVRMSLGHPAVKSVAVDENRGHPHLTIKLGPGFDKRVAREDISSFLDLKKDRPRPPIVGSNSK